MTDEATGARPPRSGSGRRTRWVWWVAIAWLATLGLAWLWGASGRFEAARAAQEAEHRRRLADARGAMLEARVGVLLSNFGDAQAALDRARAALEAARPRYLALGQVAAAGALDEIVQRVAAARDQAAALDRAAGETTAEALAALARLEAGAETGAGVAPRVPR
jgi:hypothetical protein